MSCSSRRNKGFTLLELLVVLLIMGSVMGVILACLHAGFETFARIRDSGTGLIDVHLAGEQLEQDLLNLWQGNRDGTVSEVLFEARRLGFSRLRMIDGASRLASVRYEVPASGGGLLRREQLEEDEGGVRVDSGSGINQGGVEVVDREYDVAFAYLAAGDNAGTWMPQWESVTNMPLAVRLTVGARDRTNEVQRTIPLPSSEKGADE